MEIEVILAIAVLVVEGPIVWWLAVKRKKENIIMTSIQETKEDIRECRNQLDNFEDTFASKSYVDDKVGHVRDILDVQLSAILEELRYIRQRMDK